MKTNVMNLIGVLMILIPACYYGYEFYINMNKQELDIAFSIIKMLLIVIGVTAYIGFAISLITFEDPSDS